MYIYLYGLGLDALAYLTCPLYTRIRRTLVHVHFTVGTTVSRVTLTEIAIDTILQQTKSNQPDLFLFFGTEVDSQTTLYTHVTTYCIQARIRGTLVPCRLTLVAMVTRSTLTFKSIHSIL